MNIEQAHASLTDHFIRAWMPTGHEYFLENRSFDPPDGETCARFLIRDTSYDQLNLGPTYQNRGFVAVQIHIPEGRGTHLATQTANLLIPHYRYSRTPEGVEFFDIELVTIGVIAKHFQTNLIANFTWDERA